METISDYENDGSAMGRINAWRMAWNLATDRPLFGGGFEIYNPAVSRNMRPNRKTFTRRIASISSPGRARVRRPLPVSAHMVVYVANGGVDPQEHEAQRRNRLGLSSRRHVAGESRRLFCRRRVSEPRLFRSAVLHHGGAGRNQVDSRPREQVIPGGDTGTRSRQCCWGTRASRVIASPRQFGLLHGMASRRVPALDRLFRWTLSVADRRPGLSILLFHRVLAVADPFRTGDMTAAQFEVVIANIARNFSILPLEEGIERLRNNSLPRAALSITFDDGYRDNLDVATPNPRRESIGATFFIAHRISGRRLDVERPDHRNLQAHASHVDIASRARVPIGRPRYEQARVAAAHESSERPSISLSTSVPPSSRRWRKSST